MHGDLNSFSHETAAGSKRPRDGSTFGPNTSSSARSKYKCSLCGQVSDFRNNVYGLPLILLFTAKKRPRLLGPKISYVARIKLFLRTEYRFTVRRFKHKTVLGSSILNVVYIFHLNAYCLQAKPDPETAGTIGKATRPCEHWRRSK